MNKGKILSFKVFESKSDSISIIESLLDDYLDEFPAADQPFTFGLKLSHYRWPIDAHNIHLTINYSRYKPDQPEWDSFDWEAIGQCDILKNTLGYYSAISVEYWRDGPINRRNVVKIINETSLFKRIYKLTGFKLFTFVGGKGGLLFDCNLDLTLSRE